jgi:hypothetical protein
MIAIQMQPLSEERTIGWYLHNWCFFQRSKGLFPGGGIHRSPGLGPEFGSATALKLHGYLKLDDMPSFNSDSHCTTIGHRARPLLRLEYGAAGPG